MDREKVTADIAGHLIFRLTKKKTNKHENIQGARQCEQINVPVRQRWLLEVTGWIPRHIPRDLLLKPMSYTEQKETLTNTGYRIP
jgi:hypothetical protein